MHRNMGWHEEDGWAPTDRCHSRSNTQAKRVGRGGGPHGSPKGTTTKNTEPKARPQTPQPPQGTREQTLPSKKRRSAPLTLPSPRPDHIGAIIKKLRAPNVHGEMSQFPLISGSPESTRNEATCVPSVRPPLVPDGVWMAPCQMSAPQTCIFSIGKSIALIFKTGRMFQRHRLQTRASKNTTEASILSTCLRTASAHTQRTHLKSMNSWLE